MTAAPTSRSTLTLPDHTQLPDSDGTFVKNLQEHPQSILLTDSIHPILQQRHPDGDYCIGQDSGIYWRLTDPLERGAEAPDWFYPIAPLGVELGLWQGRYQNVTLPWLRWWDAQGRLLLTGEERAEQERQKRQRLAN
jgi:hypothetical protein